MAYRTTIYDSAFIRLMGPREGADAFGNRLGRKILTVATTTAPKSGRKIPRGRWGGSEHLSTKHRLRGRLYAGGNPLRPMYPIENTASYAEWVHNGTLTRPPRAHGPNGMWAGKNELRGAYTGRGAERSKTLAYVGQTARGQKPNLWLKKAGLRVAGKYASYLRP